MLRRAHRQLVVGVVLAAAATAAAALDRQLVVVPSKPAPAGERRVALVIGNSAYKTSPLRNPVNDARAISKALSATGFKVTVLEDGSEVAMRRAIRAFGDELAQGGVGLFYYAGHGMQVRGRNYLIPVNADIEREDEVEDQAIDANLVLSKMDSAKNALNLMILDACRNNPFARAFRSAAQGLAQMDAPSGTLIAFATAPGSVASDGDGDNGLYTKHLLANMTRPGIPIEQLFKEVRIGVGKDTKDRQVPWESSSLRGNFFFIAPDPSLSAEAQKQQLEKAVAEAVRREQEKLADEQRKMTAMIREMLEKQRAELAEEMRRREEALGRKPAAVEPPAPPPPPAPAVDREVVFWESIKNSTNPEDFKAYLAQWPKGTFAALAQTRLTPVPAAPVAPVAAAPAAPAAPAPAVAPPTQVASIAPTPVAAEPLPPRFPKLGDKWEYQYSDYTGSEKRKLTVEITGVSKEGILDFDNFHRGGYTSTRAHSAGTDLEIIHPLWQFSPYLLAFDEAKPGTKWKGINGRADRFCSSPTIRSCNYEARVLRREKVTTPAGTFDAIKVEVYLEAESASAGSGFGRIGREALFWYSESAKRIVKARLRTTAGRTNSPDWDLELVSYKLN